MIKNDTTSYLLDRFKTFRSEAEENLANLMIDNGIAMISFVHNGDNTDFAVDSANMFVESTDANDIVSREVVAVAVVKETKQLILFSDVPTDEVLSTMMEEFIVVFPTDEVVEAINNVWNESYVAYTLDDTFAPNDTLLELLVSIPEAMKIGLK